MDDAIDQIIHKLPAPPPTLLRTSSNNTKTMTVRMPLELYESLKEEAAERNTSANKLAVAKLSIRGDILDRVVAAAALATPY